MKCVHHLNATESVGSLKNDFDVANCPAVAGVHNHNTSNAVPCWCPGH